MTLVDTPSTASLRIGDTDFDLKWILHSLSKKDEVWKRIAQNRIVTGVKAENIGDGKGYASVIYKVTLEFENSDRNPYSVVLKVPHVTSVHESLDPEEKNKQSETQIDFWEAIVLAHSRECLFYNSYWTERIPTPKVFVAQEVIIGKQQGAILMEYIDPKRATTVPIYSSLNVQQVHELVRQVAWLHAYSLSLSESFLRKCAPTDRFCRMITDFYSSMHKAAFGVDPLLEELLKPIQHFAGRFDFFDYCFHGIHKELGMRPVLVHSDMWSNNIFWKLREDGSVDNNVEALIDWQGVHEGNAGEDIARAVLLSTDADIRKEAEMTMFDVYIDALREGAKYYKVEPTYTKEQVEACYRRVFTSQVLVMIVCISFMFTPKSLITEREEQIWQARKEKFALRTRIALRDAIEIVKTDIPYWFDENYRYKH